MKESINPLWQNDLVPSCLVAFKPSNQQWDLQNLSLSTCKKEFDTFSDIFLDTKVNVRQYLTIGFHSSYVQQNFQISSSGFCEKMVPYWGLIMGKLRGLAGALIIIFVAMSSRGHVKSCGNTPLYHHHIHDHQLAKSPRSSNKFKFPKLVSTYLLQGIHRGRGQRNGPLACCTPCKKVFLFVWKIWIYLHYLKNNLSALLRVTHFFSGVSQTNNWSW